MILKNLNPTKNYFNKKEIIRIINTFENIVKQEVLKKDSQYTIVIENKNTKYRVANTKIILEDMLIKPLAKEIKKAMNLEEQKQTYKLPIMGQDNELYEFEIPKSKLNCPINLQRTAKQIINEIHDATKEGKKDLPIYKVHTKTNSFFGVNLELMIKRKFGYKLHDAITEYMESKYGYLAHSEYFNFEIQCYSNLNYILKPDIFTSTGNEMISKLIGVEEKKKEKNNHTKKKT
ncbi:MAG: hypothetical protein KKH40_01375 [Nanoarchaeota archaeon]|nr:hypothetical protein [Nanoarchaeota archaeon]